MQYGDLMKLVDMLALEASAFGCQGSTPWVATMPLKLYLAERILGRDEVVGSTPTSGSLAPFV
jgi:hypothetical protein